MKAKDIMTTNVVTVAPDTDVQSIARRLLGRGISAVPVVDESGRIVGIVSEGDLMRRPESATERHPSWWLGFITTPDEQARSYTKSHGRKAKDVMTRKVVTVSEDASLDEIATLLERNRIKRVPVVRDGKIVGIVSRANMLHGLAAGAGSPLASANDAQIRENLTRALEETGIRTQYINVVVSDGVAHLWGMVETDAQKEAAHVAAESTGGVQRVEDNISIMPQMVRATLGAE
jgi:CBS domain-containing protein